MKTQSHQNGRKEKRCRATALQIVTIMPNGYLSLVLHAHLPFVRHPEYPDFLEEDWLYEAISETYIYLFRCLR